MCMKLKHTPILVIVTLAILTPGIPEYLTGSSQIALILVNPGQFLINLALNLGLYTAGVLLIREFAIRFKKGWASILLLGAAYGILEEGIALHTFFQTSGNPAGFLATYGHLIGINAVWAIGITAFHALFSVALPILILELAYPEWKGRSLIGRRGIIGTSVIYMSAVLILNSYAGFKPSDTWYIALIAIAASLIYAAYRIKSTYIKRHYNSLAGFIGKHGFVAGVSALFAYGMYAIILPKVNGITPIFDTVIFLPLISISIVFLLNCEGRQQYNREKLYFAMGMVVTLVIWAETLEFLGVARGITIISIIAILLLYRLWKIRHADITTHIVT